jgi:hypothetical protein
MSNSWSKEDRVHFESSEVMKQLEKNLIDNYKKLEAIQNKIASNAQENTEKFKNLTESINEAEAAMASFTSASDDGQLASDAADSPSDDEDRSDDDSDNLADKEAVLEDLRKMIKIALDEKEYDLVYKIERTIDSINDKEVVCE